MRKFIIYVSALFAMAVFASASALAQEGARRNKTVTERQEAIAERKQDKVDEGQKSANVSNQAATDERVRTSGGSGSDRRNGNNSDSSSGKVGNGSGYSGNSGNNSGNVGNSGSNGGNVGSNNRPPAGGNNGGYGNNSGNRPSSGNGGYGHNGGYGNNNGGGYRPPVSNSGHNGYPGGYGNNYPGYRPSLPNTRDYDRYDSYYRTSASSIVLRTYFRSKEEAYRYVEMLLLDSDYIIGTYGNGYSWIQSEASFIPTPGDWTSPMTHNQFRIKVSFAKCFGTVTVTISGDWRESMLSYKYSPLRFQPNKNYSTYYAWNVLEDLAESIPHSSLSYR